MVLVSEGYSWKLPSSLLKLIGCSGKVDRCWLWQRNRISRKTRISGSERSDFSSLNPVCPEHSLLHYGLRESPAGYQNLCGKPSLQFEFWSLKLRVREGQLRKSNLWVKSVPASCLRRSLSSINGRRHKQVYRDTMTLSNTILRYYSGPFLRTQSAVTRVFVSISNF